MLAVEYQVPLIALNNQKDAGYWPAQQQTLDKGLHADIRPNLRPLEWSYFCSVILLILVVKTRNYDVAILKAPYETRDIKICSEVVQRSIRDLAQSAVILGALVDDPSSLTASGSWRVEDAS
ncbi:hypothetical protein ACQ4WX_20080 [Streptomyces lasalocidi]